MALFVVGCFWLFLVVFICWRCLLTMMECVVDKVLLLMFSCDVCCQEVIEYLGGYRAKLCHYSPLMPWVSFYISMYFEYLVNKCVLSLTSFLI